MMEREIALIDNLRKSSWCCPGHDKWPSSTYGSNRSKRARARDKAREHRYARRVTKILFKEENGRTIATSARISCESCKIWEDVVKAVWRALDNGQPDRAKEFIENYVSTQTIQKWEE
jgi:hypothetical protein